MVWLCPTLGRPHRLRQLAQSWERCQPRTPLHVRLYINDPKLGEYRSQRWPKSWLFYLSDKLRCGPTMNEFALEKCPDASTYGFVADDVVLRTKAGLEHLDALADPFFIAYPNDCIQRERLCTHFSVGGELVRELGWWALPGMAQTVDMPLMDIGLNARLLRYAPGVVFQHKHFLLGAAAKDDTYAAVYQGKTTTPNADFVVEDETRLLEWRQQELPKTLIQIARRLFVESEDWDEWNEQDRVDALILPETEGVQ